MQHDSRNISMLMDFYEMTMAHGYFTKQEEMDRVAFDVFFRRNPDKGGFAIFGGLEQIVEYILNWLLYTSDAADDLTRVTIGRHIRSTNKKK